jgi:hypothetical protein
MIYTAPSVMVLMREATLYGQVGRGWALEIDTNDCSKEYIRTEKVKCLYVGTSMLSYRQ